MVNYILLDVDNPIPWYVVTAEASSVRSSYLRGGGQDSPMFLLVYQLTLLIALVCIFVSWLLKYFISDVIPNSRLVLLTCSISRFG
jgi:flagellar biogenesis protein FliO